jgi:hypothetical protein
MWTQRALKLNVEVSEAMEKGEIECLGIRFSDIPFFSGPVSVSQSILTNVDFPFNSKQSFPRFCGQDARAPGR